MVKDVKYTIMASFIGRNGAGKQSGLVFTRNGDILSLEPINSKNHISHCRISIPFCDIPDVISQLQTAYKKYYNLNK